MTYRQVGTNSFTVKYYVEKFILDMNTMKIIRVDEYRDKKKINRPAGSLFSVDGEIYRVAQKCSRAYGESIFVYKTSKNFDFIKDKKAIILLNKSDLASKVSADDIKKLVDKTVISVSAKESLGIDELSDTIKDMFFDGEVSFNDEIYITNIRHKKLLSDAKESLKLVMNSIDDDMPEDFYSIDLMSAYESLGLIIGESVEDDLMDEIFSKFCMGK